MGIEGRFAVAAAPSVPIASFDPAFATTLSIQEGVHDVQVS